MTFERQPKQPQEMTEMSNELPTIECIETLAYNVKYTASDAACHEMLCDAVMRRIVPSEIALDIAEQYAVRSFTEQTAKDLKEELDRLQALESEDSPAIPQQAYDHETSEETHLLDSVKMMRISPGESVYYSQDGISIHYCKQTRQDVCLVSHYDEIDVECAVFELDSWSRIDALAAIRSLHERLQSV